MKLEIKHTKEIRNYKWKDIPEEQVCKKHKVKMVFNIGHGGKVRSSSVLLKEYSKHLKN